MENVIYISESGLLYRMLEINIQRISVRLIFLCVRQMCYSMKDK
jgi:hypothetical protein